MRFEKRTGGAVFCVSMAVIAGAERVESAEKCKEIHRSGALDDALCDKLGEYAEINTFLLHAIS